MANKVTAEEYITLRLLGYEVCCHCLEPTGPLMLSHCDKCLYYTNENGKDRMHHVDAAECLEVSTWKKTHGIA